MTHWGKIMKNLLNKSLFLSVATVIAFFMGATADAVADTTEALKRAEPRTVVVTGVAKRDYEPDVLRISLTLVSRDRELAVAKRLSDEQLERLLGVTKKYNISHKNLVTSNIRSNPEYSRTRKNDRQLVGYKITRKISIIVKDAQIQEELMASFVDAEINQVNAVRFDLSDPDEKRAALRVEAFSDAKRKANALARVANSRLGNALEIHAQDSNGYSAPHHGMMAVSVSHDEIGAGTSAPQVDGSVTLEERVKVVFEMVSKQ